MNAERTFTNVDDAVLVSLTSNASQRVMFVAPGLRAPVAEALANAMKRLPGRVTVVLDVDAEVCRLGYGDEQGLQFMKSAAEEVGMETRSWARHVVSDRPVDRDVLPDHFNQFPGNRFERVIAKTLDGAVCS